MTSTDEKNAWKEILHCMENNVVEEWDNDVYWIINGEHCYGLCGSVESLCGKNDDDIDAMFETLSEYDDTGHYWFHRNMEGLEERKLIVKRFITALEAKERL